jgi:hypothetical protein
LLLTFVEEFKKVRINSREEEHRVQDLEARRPSAWEQQEPDAIQAQLEGSSSSGL